MIDNKDRRTTERKIAGAMVIDAKTIDTAAKMGVGPELFNDPAARAIVKTCQDRRAANEYTDVLTVSQDCGREWVDVEQCVDAVVTITETPYYLQRLKNYEKLDRLTRAAHAISAGISTATPDTVQDTAVAMAGQIDAAIQNGRILVERTLGAAAVEWLDKMTAADEDSVLLDWPLESITRNVGRLDRELVWIIAQPSIGKTAFVLMWLLLLAKQGHVVSLASLESSADSIASRAISQTAPMDNRNIRQRRASDQEIQKAYDAAAAIPDAVRITDGSMTLDQLAAWGKAEARNGSRLLVIDNTRHITVPGMGSDRVNAVAAISTTAKQIRDETGVPVVMLHHSTVDRQTGRETESWSSDIRRDADIMIFLKRDDDLSREPQTEFDNGLNAVRFCVDKNREGRSGFDVLMEFRKECQLFKPWEQ